MEDETFDYGLDPGESFIPELDDFVDPSAPHVMTVLGPIDPESLGPANLVASFVPRHREADLGAMLTEIHECAAVGLNALVDLTPISSEMEARAALWLAERCDIHLIVSTGPDSHHDGASNVNRMLEHASIGLFSTEVAPGLIVSDPAKSSVSAAISARGASGLPIVIESRPEPAAHIDILTDVAVVTDAQSGSPGNKRQSIIDLASGENPRSLADFTRLNVEHSNVLFGYDPPSKRPDQFSRWSWLIEEFPIALMELGLSPVQVRSILVDRPAAFLRIERPAPHRC